MAGPQTGMYHQQQPQAFGVQPGYGMSAQTGMSNPFNSGFASNSPAFLGNQPAYGQPPMGMFPSGPSPAVPARPGAMRPPVNTAVQTGAAQNPFGDAFGSGMGVMAPQSNSSSLVNGSASVEEKKEKSDPFANLLPGIGSGAGSATNKKDMFKNFQMAKPAPPPRSSDNVSANFEDYMRNSVGGVPLQTDDSNNNPPPMAAPRSNLGMDPFGAPAPPPATTAPSNDPFAMFDLGASNTDQTFTFANQVRVAVEIRLFYYEVVCPLWRVGFTYTRRLRSATQSAWVQSEVVYQGCQHKFAARGTQGTDRDRCRLADSF